MGIFYFLNDAICAISSRDSLVCHLMYKTFNE